MASLLKFRNAKISKSKLLFVQIRNANKPPPPQGAITNKKTKFGPLQDEDRVFQNLYGRHDWTLPGAVSRGEWYKTKEIICKGADWIFGEVSKSAIRGRGGGGFYVATKMETMKKKCSDSPKYIIGNCAEGEPGTCKDREIMRHDPHKLIEGMLLAAVCMNCRYGIIYIRGRFYNEACNLQYAIAEAYRKGLIGKNACESGFDFDLFIQRGGRYICGEESGQLNCLEGEIGRPRRKPPFITDEGYFCHSTVVLNGETIATLPTLLRRGSCWFASLGRTYNSGTKLFNISGHVKNPCTVEEEMSIPLRDIIERHAGGVLGGWDQLKAVFPGGSSSPILPKKLCDKISMDFDSLRKVGSGLGTGGIIVISKKVDILKVFKRVLEFYKEETCRQCNQCREGIYWENDQVARFVVGNAQKKELDWLVDITKWIEGKTICAFADSHAFVCQGLIKHFRKDIEDRIAKYEASK